MATEIVRLGDVLSYSAPVNGTAAISDELKDRRPPCGDRDAGTNLNMHEGMQDKSGLVHVLGILEKACIYLDGLIRRLRVVCEPELALQGPGMLYREMMFHHFYMTVVSMILMSVAMTSRRQLYLPI